MQTVREELIKKIDAMPDETVAEVFDYVSLIEDENLEDIDGPESVQVRTRDDFLRKIKRGLDDVKAGRVYSLEESLEKMRQV